MNKRVVVGRKQARDGVSTTVDKIKFRSKLEARTYTLMKEAGLVPDYERESFTLIPAFSFMGVKIRPITYKPDFIYKDFIIECKGWGNDAWPIREKLFKYYLHSINSNYKFYVIRTNKELDELITIIKQNHD